MYIPRITADVGKQPLWDGESAEPTRNGYTFDLGLMLRRPRLNDHTTFYERDVGRVFIVVGVTRTRRKLQSVELSLVY